jgi:hypothetical protein
LTQSFSITEVIAISGANKTITITSDEGGPYTLLRGKTGNLFTLTGSGTTVSFTNCVIDGNKASSAYATNAGGCLFNVNATATGDVPNLIIGEGAVFQNNKTSTGNAGGILITKGYVLLADGGAVRGNEGTNGGIYIASATARNKLEINGGIISENIGSSVGGIYIYNGDVLFNDGSIDHNSGSNGGGVYIYTSGKLTMNGGVVTENVAPGGGSKHGGGIDVSGANADFTMNGGTVLSNHSSYGGGISIHASSTGATIHINAGTIQGNTADGENAVGAGILFYQGGTSPAKPVAAKVYIGINENGQTTGTVKFINNQGLLGKAGAIGATNSGTALPTAAQLLDSYWPNLFVGPLVTFSSNQSSEGRDISANACTAEDCSSDVDADMELLCTKFRTLAASNIKATRFTAPFTFGYNDFDIQMPIGCKVAAVVVTFHPNNGEEDFTYFVPQGGKVPNPTVIGRCGQDYTFWYEDPECTIPWDFNTLIYLPVDIYGKSIYIPCEYKNVVFVSNGGSVTPSQIVVTGDSAVEPPAPQRGCDKFLGWYIDPELTIPYDFSEPILGTIVLYAKWRVVPNIGKWV